MASRLTQAINNYTRFMEDTTPYRKFARRQGYNLPIYGDKPMTPAQQIGFSEMAPRVIAELAPVTGEVIDARDYWRLSGQGLKNIMQGNIIRGLQDYSNAIVSGVGAIPGVGAPADISQMAGKGLPWFMSMVSPVFHGSPHKFTKFTTEKIGTGEGAQAFGWGLYFTDKKDIAKHYSAKLSDRPDVKIGKGFTPQTDADKTVLARLGERYRSSFAASGRAPDKDQIINTVRDDIEIGIEANMAAGDSKIVGRLMDQKVALDRFKDLGIDFQGKGSLYKATLFKGKDPSEYTWLDWDKRPSDKLLDKLSEKIAIEDYGPVENWRGDFETSADLYKYLSDRLGSDKEASLFLNRAGISGIRYPAGSLSGMKDTGAKNYVVFDESAIDIESVNERPIQDILY